MKIVIIVSGLAIWLLVASGDAAVRSVSAQTDDSSKPVSIIRIGILSHRPLEEAQAYWRPLGEALDAAFPDKSFEIILSDFSRLDKLVDQGAVDLVLTNPNHFIQLRARLPGMWALATAIEEIEGQLFPSFGGVIVVRAEDEHLQALDNLRGRTVAAVEPQSLGGYRTQIYELYAYGVPLPTAANTVFTDMPHDNVIDALLEGRVDVGFVRTGVIEQMIAEGKLDASRLRVLNPQNVAGFPLALSTRLYPQWPLVAMPDMSVEDANRIAGALFTLALLENDSEGEAGLRFTVAADYRAVEQLAQALRLPPFEEIPRVTVREFVITHPVISISLMLLIVALLVVAGMLTFARGRLEETAGSLQRLIASVPVGLTEAKVDLDGKPQLVYVSERAARLVGMTTTDRKPTLDQFTKNMHAEDVEPFIAANYRAIADQAPMNIEVRFMVNRQWRWLRITSNPLKRPDGELVWSGSLMDVTDLQHANALFKSVFKQSPIAMMVHDPRTGRILDANPRAWKEYGFEGLAEFLENQDAIWLEGKSENAQKAVRLLRRAAKGKTLQFDWPGRKLDGEIIWHNVTLSPIRFAGKSRVLALCVDVTKQREADKQLRESEKRFRTLLRDVEGVAIQGYHLDGTVIYWNRASEALYGYTSEEALQSNLLDLIIPEAMKPDVRANLARVAEGGEIKNGELELIAKDGRSVPVYSSHSVLRSPGKPPELFCLDIDLTERKRHESELHRAAYYDALTGLPNRIRLGQLMREAFSSAEAQGASLALCCVDLDNFQHINDEYGAAFGDRMLVTVAERLGECVNNNEIVARLGGDEFVLLLNEASTLAQIEQRLQYILDTIAEPVSKDGRTLECSASMGVTRFPQDANDPDVLLRHANEAMFEAKRRGRCQYSLFDPTVEQALERRRQRLGEIRTALSQNQFVLHFQPKVNMITGDLLGMEALARWQHPDEGILLPRAFIDHVDGTELEHQFGDWVISEALRQISQWNAQGLAWHVSVNVPSALWTDRKFAEGLRNQLQSFPSVQPGQLELEILETAATSDLAVVMDTLRQLNDLGVRVSLDDFGTGYSSLSRLRRLPVDALKIDQSFVRNMLADLSDYNIVRSVIALARTFSLDVIAEGVETLEHAEALIQLGCQFGQGYGFARPMPADALPDWFANWQKNAVWDRLDADRSRKVDKLLAIAINTHEAWLQKLTTEAREGQSISRPDVLRHDRCSLGLWLNDEGRRRFGEWSEYPKLLECHDAFHRVAEVIVAKRMANQPCSADQQRKLEQISARLKKMLLDMGRLG
ncbi:MAG: EAL domain-containing protein [Wenzhouxiangella sp.]